MTTTPPVYKVVPTDCRTGFLVVTATGRAIPHSLRRRREAAAELAAEMNAHASENRAKS